WTETGDRRGPSPLHAHGQLPRGMAWASLAGRFSSFVLDEPYLLTTARSVELNPVRAGLINAPRGYRWSSAAAHVPGRDDTLVRVARLHAGPQLACLP